ncbi:MAG: putative sugar phosphate isomerase YwlF [Candidatus Izimaplasma bacterium HR2]|nr:MAG: putative sugar phosphate isomerase YwlF [Candidatus Izimaplasma bacterium HR2]
MKIAIGADHGGFDHKEVIFKHLKDNGFEVVDFGTYSSDSVDYNDFAVKVATGVSKKEYDRGILICGTGIGMSVMANKVEGIRAALVHDLFTAEATRLHNDSNILAMGGRIISIELALQIVDIWIGTEFSNEDRHIRRVKKINNYKGE